MVLKIVLWCIYHLPLTNYAKITFPHWGYQSDKIGVAIDVCLHGNTYYTTRSLGNLHTSISFHKLAACDNHRTYYHHALYLEESSLNIILRDNNLAYYFLFTVTV